MSFYALLPPLYCICILCISSSAFSADCDIFPARLASLGAIVERSDVKSMLTASLGPVRARFICYHEFVKLSAEAEAHQPPAPFFSTLAQLAAVIDDGPSAEIRDALGACAGIGHVRPADRVGQHFSRGKVECVVLDGPLSSYDVEVKKHS